MALHFGSVTGYVIFTDRGGDRIERAVLGDGNRPPPADFEYICLEYDKKPMKYMVAQYVIGIWEFHVNDLNPGPIKDMNEYIPTLRQIKRRLR